MKKILTTIAILTGLTFVGCSSFPNPKDSKQVYLTGILMPKPAGEPYYWAPILNNKDKNIGELRCYRVPHWYDKHLTPEQLESQEHSGCETYLQCDGILSEKPFATKINNIFYFDTNQDGKLDKIILNPRPNRPIALDAPRCPD